MIKTRSKAGMVAENSDTGQPQKTHSEHGTRGDILEAFLEVGKGVRRPPGEILAGQKGEKRSTGAGREGRVNGQAPQPLAQTQDTCETARDGRAR